MRVCDLWIVTHADLTRTARVRALFEGRTPNRQSGAGRPKRRRT
jgi:hypothetical protein